MCKDEILFQSQNVWEVVEKGIRENASEAWQSKDAKALFLLQQVVDEDTFTIIKGAFTAKKAWETL